MAVTEADDYTAALGALRLAAQRLEEAGGNELSRVPPEWRAVLTSAGGASLAIVALCEALDDTGADCETACDELDRVADELLGRIGDEED